MTIWTSPIRNQRLQHRLIRSVALLFVALLTIPSVVVHADAVNGKLPAGTNISVSIDSPINGAVLKPGPVTVQGAASIGPALPVANTAIVYVLDVSYSTQWGSGCGYDSNNDGLSAKILDCEILAAKTLNDDAVSTGTVADVGLAVFGTDGAAADVSPIAGEQLTTKPNTDADGASGRDIEQVLGSAYSIDNRIPKAWFKRA